MFLAYQPYKGPASIPHVGGEFFGAFFLAMNVRCFNSHLEHIELQPVTLTFLFMLQTTLLAHMFPGSVFGSELRARKWE